MPWRMRWRASTASTPIRSCRRWPRKRSADWERACRASCKIRAISMPGPKCSTAPGWRRISAPKSGSSTPSRNACGNGSISTTPTPMPSPRPTLSASTAPRRPRPWRASSARSASSDAARGLYDLNVRLGLPTGLKGLGLREDDIAKAVDVVAAVKITHPRPVGKADLANIIGQAYAGEPPRY